MPLISVIIPTFNRRDSISKAIESVLKQTFSDWELIIVDDGSEDDTCEIVKPFLLDSKIQVVIKENQGVSSARNSGAKVAKGDWLIFLDSDDILLFDALETFVVAMKSDLSLKALKSGFNIKQGEVEKTDLPEKGRFHSFIPGSFILRKELFEAVGGYDEDLKFSENTELFHRIGLTNEGMGIILKATVVYHNQPDGGSKNLKNMTESLLHILKRHQKTLSINEKRLYNQIIGVNALRFQEFKLAQNHFLKAYIIKPSKLDTLGRLIISYVPFLSRKIYKPL